MSGTETSHILLHLLHPRTGSVFRPEIGTMHANPVTESYRFAQRDSQHILKFTGAFLKEIILQLYSVYCNAGHLKLFSRVRATLPHAVTWGDFCALHEAQRAVTTEDVDHDGRIDKL